MLLICGSRVCDFKKMDASYICDKLTGEWVMATIGAGGVEIRILGVDGQLLQTFQVVDIPFCVRQRGISGENE